MNFSLTINLGEATLGLLTRLCESIESMVDASEGMQRVQVRVDNQTAQGVAANPAGAVQALQQAVQMPGTHAGVTPPAGPSAAEVFGGNAVPSGVAAAPSPSAPAAPMAGVQIPVFGAQPPAASAPAPAAAPSAPAAAMNPAGGVELDTDGLPWDARIHGSTKTKNADGRWRAKKGLNDAALVERVKAELRAVMGAPAPTPAPAAPVAPPAGPSAAEVFGGNASPAPAPSAMAPAMPAAAGSTAPPAAAPAGPTADPTTMPELMTRLTPHNIPPAKVAAACQMFQLPSVTALMQRPDLVPYVWQALREEFPQLA